MLSCGLDFGTSNTALSLVQGGRVRALQVDADHDPPETIPTLLFFSEDQRQFYGTRAVREYLDREMAGRFVQSVKRHLPSRAFDHTFINGRQTSLPELIAGFLEHLKMQAEQEVGAEIRSVLMGRPAVFHEDPERDRLAERRLEEAASLAGFVDVEFQLEPIAAARAFEQQLDEELLCLVGDLGGGTSDFTVMRLGPGRVGRDRRDDVLGSAGVPRAGNDLDAAIVRTKVLPRLGFGSSWRPIGRPVPIPTRLHVAMTSWHALSFVNTPNNLAELQSWMRSSSDPQGLGRLHEILDWNLGFSLFRAVEAAKVALSRSESTRLQFSAGKVELDEAISRAEFELAIAPMMGELGSCVDGLLRGLSLERDAIGAVFLTGGSSLVPAIRQVFESRFPGRLLGKDVFTQVGAGLGVEARERFAA